MRAGGGVWAPRPTGARQGGAVRAGRRGRRLLRGEWRCGAGVLRIATPVCALVRNDSFLAVRCGRDDAGIVPYEKPVERGQCAPPLRARRMSAAAHMGAALRVRGKGARCGRDVEDAVPYAEHEAPACGASGKSAKRRRWRKKRAGFEEVPRLAATTVDGNRLARRRAIAAPYA